MTPLDLIAVGDILTLKTSLIGPYQVRVKTVSPSYFTANGKTVTIVCDRWRYSPGDEWIETIFTHKVAERDSVTIVKI